MKQRLQTTLGQQLVLTPQLRQALHILQLSTVELETEILAALESNPLLDWEDEAAISTEPAGPERDKAAKSSGDGSDEPTDTPWEQQERWGDAQFSSSGGSGQSGGGFDGSDTGERIAQTDSLQDHLAWQLHLSALSPTDRRIGAALIDAIDDDGYLRESLDSIVQTLLPDTRCTADEVLAALHQIQRFDPTGVGARDLGECLQLQLAALPDDTPCKALAQRTAETLIEQLPKLGASGLAAALPCSDAEARGILDLLRTLDPRPGGQVGDLPQDTYVVPDCVISLHNGMWQVELAGGQQPRLTIHRGYEQMIGHASSADSGYLRGRLQEARWLLKNLEARGETLLKVVRCLVRQQSGFLEFGPQALRPLTLREVAGEIGMHESTVSRAVSRKYARTPRGTLPLRAFFASGVDNEGGGGTSSTAIQDMIRRMVEAENPRKPLSDARLSDALKASGVAVARRTVAKYREALHIPSSHDRVRIG